MNNQHKTIDHCFALCAAMAFLFSAHVAMTKILLKVEAKMM